MKKAILLLLFCAQFVYLQLSYAEDRPRGQETGGGDVFVCREAARRGVFVEVVYLADTYEHFKSKREFDESEQTILGAFNHREFVSAFLEYVALHVPDNATLYRSLLDQLVFIEVAELPELDGDGINAVPAGCRKVQLAIQNLTNFEVRYRKDLYDKLTEIEKGLFRVHEAFLKAHIHLPRETAAGLRQLLFDLVGDPDFINTLIGHLMSKIERGETPLSGLQESPHSRFSAIPSILRQVMINKMRACLPHYVTMLDAGIRSIEAAIGPERTPYFTHLNGREDLFPAGRSVTSVFESVMRERENCFDRYDFGYFVNQRENQSLADMKMELAVYRKIIEAFGGGLRGDTALDAYLLRVQDDVEAATFSASPRGYSCSTMIIVDQEHRTSTVLRARLTQDCM